MAKLRKINKRKGNDCLVLAYDPEEPLTYREAKDRIQDWELSRRAYEQQQILSSDLDDCVDSYWEEHHWDDDYEESERGRFDSACSEILDAWNFDKHGDLPNRKQVAEAWKLVKSRKPNNAKLPTRGELVAALIELFQRFKSQARASSAHGEPKGADSRNSNPPTESQLKILREWEFELDPQVEITADKLEAFIKLDGKPARDEDLKLITSRRFTYFDGDAIAAYSLAVLIRYFERIAPTKSRRDWDDRRIGRSCLIAKGDPAFQTPTLTLDQWGRVIFAWPERKLQEWYRKGAR